MRDFLKSFLSALVFGLVFPPCLVAQDSLSARIAAQSKTPTGSIPLTAVTVADCITVEAVLLPRKPVDKLFSSYVAANFAVVKTTISNHCSNQQFILHNIFFDYSNWALSGVYQTSLCANASQTSAAQPTKPVATTPPNPSQNKQADGTVKSNSPATNTSNSNVDPYIMCTKPGQVATIGAIDIQDEVTEDSVFSKRNLIINGLTLVGQVAGGYAFVGSTAAVQGIGAFNSAFVPNLAKFWPDRRLDQEKFLLALGYRTDQTTAIAKDDHGSYYAFFPLATFLTPNLQKLFLDDPAVFMNPAEAFLEPNALAEIKSQQLPSKKDKVGPLRQMLWAMAQTISSGSSNQLTPEQLLVDLSSSCHENPNKAQGKTQEETQSENTCPSCGDPTASTFNACVNRIAAEKTLFAKASLNSAKIVVRGVMTIEIDAIPPTIGEVNFDDEQKGEAAWTIASAPQANPAGAKDTPAKAQPAQKQAASDNATNTAAKDNSSTPPANQRSGKITGKFLSDSTIAITGIVVASDPTAKATDYVTDLQISSTGTSDTVPFTVTLVKQMPSGTKLTFQATRTSSQTSDSSQASLDPKSNSYVYIVNYNDPTLTKVTIENDTAAASWQKGATVSVTATGTNLTGASVKVDPLEIDGKAVPVANYIGQIQVTMTGASSLTFTFPLLYTVPDSAKISFVASTTSGTFTLSSKPLVYSVQYAKPAASKPAAKSTTHPKKRTP